MTEEDSSPDDQPKPKSSARKRADAIKPFRCKFLTAVIECPSEMRNIGTVVRNVNALGVEKVYVIDPRGSLPGEWEEMRARPSLMKPSVSASKWSFIKRFDTTAECINHLRRNNYASIVTSPHIKGKANAIFDEVDYTAHGKLAVWFGSESRGISDEAVENRRVIWQYPPPGTPMDPPFTVLLAVERVDVAAAQAAVDEITGRLGTFEGIRLPQATIRRLG